MQYGQFERGEIVNPNKRTRKSRVGETSISTNGEKMTIIRYEGTNDVTVMFEDGTVVEHVRCNNFVKGRIANPNNPCVRNNRIYKGKGSA